ncbi:TolC Outer membrane protein [Methylophilaceae bacterium]
MIRRLPKAIALTCVLLSGCSFIPELQRPDLGLPESYRDAPEQNAAGQSMGDQDWRTVFNDPQLQRLIEEALASGNDALLAAARLREAEALAGVARAPLYPQASLSLNTSPTARLPGDGFTSNFMGGAGISWEIDLWGRYRSASAAAKAEMLASAEGKHAVQSSLISSVAGYYYQLAALNEIQAVTLRAVENHRTVLTLIKRLSAAGISSAAEERQQESALATIEVRLPQLRRQIAEAENALSILLARNPGAFTFNAAVTLDLPEAIPAGLPSALLDRRPDIREAEDRMLAANARIGEAKALFFPNVSLTALFGGVSTRLTDLLNSQAADVASIGPDVMLPLFTGGRLTFNRDAAIARMEQAVISYRKTVLGAMGEVANALIAYETSLDALSLQTNRVETSRESLRLAELRFRSGTASFLEVLEAQRQVLSAETDQVQTLLERRSALIKIYLALGGGWEDDQKPENPESQ